MSVFAVLIASTVCLLVCYEVVPLADFYNPKYLFWLLIFIGLVYEALFLFRVWLRCRSTVAIVVDNSNVFIPAVAVERAIDYKHLRYFLQRPAPVSTGVFSWLLRKIFGDEVFLRDILDKEAHITGSTPPRDSKVWKRARSAGFHVHLLQRDQLSNRETGIDTHIIALAHHLGLKLKNSRRWYSRLIPVLFPGPAMIVVTGDGNADNPAISFPEMVRDLLHLGVDVEVASWRKSLSGEYRKIQRDANMFSGRFTLRYLDSAIDYVTRPYHANEQ